MLKRVVITNYLGESVEYKIEGVDVYENNGLLITEIEGLGPTGANITFNNLVSIDGSLYNSARIESRNIVIHACFTWSKTIEESRLSSYRLFPLKKQVKIEVETENRKAYTYGYVEKNEPDIFKPQTDVMISIMCESPFFLDSGGSSEDSFTCTEPLFEFVYENEGAEPVTEMGNKSDKTINTVVYNGETEIGYTIKIHALGRVTNPKIYFIDSGDMLTFDTARIEQITSKTFDDGDDIVLVMEDRNKACYFVSNGISTNILNVVDRGFSWPKLTPGATNHYHVSADSGEDYLRFFVEYQAVYEGV